MGSFEPFRLAGFLIFLYLYLKEKKNQFLIQENKMKNTTSFVFIA